MTQRMYSPSPTVRSSRVPLYLRGVSPGVFAPEDRHTAALLQTGLDADTVDLIFGAVSNGQISREQFEQISRGEMPEEEIQKLLYGVSPNPVPTNAINTLFPLMEIALSGLGDNNSDYTISPDGTIAVDNLTGNIVDLTTGTVFDSSGNIFTQSLDSAYQNLLASQTKDTNPLDYLTPQAAIAAGIPPSQVNAAWTPAAQAKAAVLQSGGTQAQAQAAANSVSPSSTAAQIAAAVSNALKIAASATTSTTGPSPRIATTPASTSSALTQALTKSSIIGGVPDLALIGGGLLVAMAMMGRR